MLVPDHPGVGSCLQELQKTVKLFLLQIFRSLFRFYSNWLKQLTVSGVLKTLFMIEHGFVDPEESLEIIQSCLLTLLEKWGKLGAESLTWNHTGGNHRA